MNELIIELKNLLNSINEESDGVEEILQSKDDLQEYTNYLRRLRQDVLVAMNTTVKDTFLKYRYRSEALLEILDLIYIYILLS